MGKSITNRERLSIEVTPQEHKKIKVLAAFHGKTIRDYVLENIREKIKLDTEESELSEMITTISPVLQELWDNKKDAAYDRL